MILAPKLVDSVLAVIEKGRKKFYMPQAPRRRIKKASIKFISLCQRGMNNMKGFYKAFDSASDGSMFEFSTLTKSDMEKGELLSLVYVPDNPDLEGDIANVEVVKEMCESFAKNKGDVDLRHDGKALGPDRAFVSQSFIVHKADPRFENFKDMDGNDVDTEGAWAVVIKIEDEELKKLYREGPDKWQGVSMGGLANIEILKSDDSELSGLEKLFKSLIGIIKSENNNQENEEMNDKDLKKISDLIDEKLSKRKEADDKVVIDLNNADQVRKHLISLEAKNIDINDVAALRNHLKSLEKSDDGEVDLSDPKSIEKRIMLLEKAEKDSVNVDDIASLKKRLKELQKSDDKDDNPELKRAKEELKKANERVAKLEKRSNQDAVDEDDEGNDIINKGDASFLSMRRIISKGCTTEKVN